MHSTWEQESMNEDSTTEKEEFIQGVMISNLPLLFANGNPTSLEKITYGELQNFIPFMIQCSLGYAAGDANGTEKPKWWPSEIPFSKLSPCDKIPAENWEPFLKSLVCRCYTYHGCEYLLHFCTQLAEHPTSDLKFHDNWDGTTSIFEKGTGKLLVTFKNENRLYDMKVEQQRKSLLPKAGQSNVSAETMVQPPLYDIYLCDKCDAEFTTLNEVKEHEKLCSLEDEPLSRPASPEEEKFFTDQAQYMKYFALQSVNSENKEPSPQKDVASSQRRRHFPGLSLTRFHGIPFSSPMGKELQKRSRITVTPQLHLDRYERYCKPVTPKPRIGGTLSERMHNEVWPVSWKQNSRKKEEPWSHSYCFSKRERRDRFLHITTGLNKRSRQLLKRCRRLVILLQKMTPEEIECHTQPSSSQEDSEVEFIAEVVLPHSASVLQKTCLNSAVASIHPRKNYLKPVDREKSDSFGIPVVDLCSSDEEEVSFRIPSDMDVKKFKEFAAAESAVFDLMQKRELEEEDEEGCIRNFVIIGPSDVDSVCSGSDSDDILHQKNGHSHWPHIMNGPVPFNSAQENADLAVNGKLGDDYSRAQDVTKHVLSLVTNCNRGGLQSAGQLAVENKTSDSKHCSLRKNLIRPHGQHAQNERQPIKNTFACSTKKFSNNSGVNVYKKDSSIGVNENSYFNLNARSMLCMQDNFNYSVTKPDVPDLCVSPSKYEVQNMRKRTASTVTFQETNIWNDIKNCETYSWRKKGKQWDSGVSIKSHVASSEELCICLKADKNKVFNSSDPLCMSKRKEPFIDNVQEVIKEMRKEFSCMDSNETSMKGRENIDALMKKENSKTSSDARNIENMYVVAEDMVNFARHRRKQMSQNHHCLKYKGLDDLCMFKTTRKFLPIKISSSIETSKCRTVSFEETSKNENGANRLDKLPKDLRLILKDECKELKAKGLEKIKDATTRVLRNSNCVEVVKKVSKGKSSKLKENSCKNNIVQTFVKNIEMEDELSVSVADSNKTTEAGNTSCADGGNKLLPKEIKMLLSDECKELRRMGLRHSYHSHRKFVRHIHGKPSLCSRQPLHCSNLYEAKRSCTIVQGEKENSDIERAHRNMIMDIGTMCILTYGFPVQ